MRVTRRAALAAGGAFCLAGPAAAAGMAEIAMAGRRDGSRVWFDPAGLLVVPGTVIRWTNRDSGNAHTATAYHPDHDGRALGIPAGAAPWDSGYLLPGESFAVTLTVPGVYDYYCAPHEAAGMAGRIVVDGAGQARAADGLPEPVRAALPEVGEILRRGRVPAAASEEEAQ